MKTKQMKTLLVSALLAVAVITAQGQAKFDLQGHRGCRGLLPENTIPAFLKAVELGVTTLELDVVISKDKQVVVSHEPYMNYQTCLDSLGNPISKDRQKEYRLYGMTMEQIRKFDCGSIPLADFPEQQKIKVTKPLLSEVIDEVEKYLREHHLPPVNYNIELKFTQADGGAFNPEPPEFVELVVKVIREKGIVNRMNIQSFDFRPLQYLNSHYPDLKTAALISNIKSLKKNIQELGYTPTCYSPYYLLTTKKLVKQAHSRGMLLIPWTINKTDDMVRIKALGVDGLITDYPDRYNSIR
jgi:glycerophosphoryl diester phosphodiesterase